MHTETARAKNLDRMAEELAIATQMGFTHARRAIDAAVTGQPMPFSIGNRHQRRKAAKLAKQQVR